MKLIKFAIHGMSKHCPGYDTWVSWQLLGNLIARMADCRQLMVMTLLSKVRKKAYQTIQWIIAMHSRYIIRWLLKVTHRSRVVPAIIIVLSLVIIQTLQVDTPATIVCHKYILGLALVGVRGLYLTVATMFIFGYAIVCMVRIKTCRWIYYCNR
jgi:hypothetical protein